MMQSLRVVVADDEPQMVKFLEETLKRLGHQVVGKAASGQQLIESVLELKPDLLITDIKMPEMDGIEAVRQFCQTHPIPVVLVSAYHDSDLIQRAMSGHVMAYLVKPIKQADLETTIAVAIRRFKEFTGAPAADDRSAASTRRSQDDRTRKRRLDEAGRLRRARRIPPTATPRQREESKTRPCRGNDRHRRRSHAIGDVESVRPRTSWAIEHVVRRCAESTFVPAYAENRLLPWAAQSSV